MRRFLGYIAVAMLLSSCFEPESFESQIVLRPYQQIYDGADFVNLEGVVAYAYMATEKGKVDDLEVLSYDDALNGVVRLADTGEVLKPIATSTPYDSTMAGMEGAVSLSTNTQWLYIVVADTANEDYAYAFYEVGLNLPESYITLLFRSWYATPVEVKDWIYIVPEGNGEVAPGSDIPVI